MSFLGDFFSFRGSDMSKRRPQRPPKFKLRAVSWGSSHPDYVDIQYTTDGITWKDVLFLDRPILEDEEYKAETMFCKINALDGIRKHFDTLEKVLAHNKAVIAERDDQNRKLRERRMSEEELRAEKIKRFNS
jgi:hypothetical protein